MTVKTTLSFTDRHHRFLARKVEEGVYATTSAAVASAVERMIEDEAAREAALGAMADEIRARISTPRSEFLEVDEALAAARDALAGAVRACRGGSCSILRFVGTSSPSPG